MTQLDVRPLADGPLEHASEDRPSDLDAGHAEPFPAFDHKRRLLLALVLALGGLLGLLVGWVGVSGTRIVSDQLAYVASGAMVGLALVALAGAVMVIDYLIEVESRLHALEARLLATRSEGSELLDVGRRKRLVVAAAFVVAGFLAILAGWLGASGTREITDQLSYLASGGVLGVALVALAGVLVLADSMSAQQAILDRIERTAADLPAMSWATPVDFDTVPPEPHADDALVIVPGGSRVHRSRCQLVAGKPVSVVVEEPDVDMQPCRICAPDLALTAVGDSSLR